MRNIFILLVCLSIMGCTSMSGGEIDQIANDFKASPSAPEKKLTVSSTYKDAFNATINVFHDLAISIPKKDFDNKEIVAIDQSVQYSMPGNSGRNSKYYITFETANTVVISIKTMPFVKYNYNAQFIFERIKNELGIK